MQPGWCFFQLSYLTGFLASLRGFLPRRDDYDLRSWRQDLLAGLTVAVVALPLALAFGVTSGAGAVAGLITAVVAGTLAAIFGGSNFQVSGPTGAMTVVLLPIVSTYGVAALPVLGVLAGLILFVFAFAGVGRYINYVPWPVITGFTNGIGIIIFLQQLPNLLGLEQAFTSETILVASWQTVSSFVADPGWRAPLLGLLAVAVMVFWASKPKLKAVPAGIVALVSVTLTSLLPVFSQVPRIGVIPQTLPQISLPLAGLDMTMLVRAAFAVAVLAALESLLSAVVADSMSVGERHDPNRELFGQGVANIAAGVVGGIPATAALARTAVNVRSGARTRLAAIVHGLALFAIAWFAAPLAAQVPLAALGGILVVVAFRMIERQSMRLIMRSTRSDTFVLFLTMVVTVLFDLILAIEVGLIAAGILFIIRVSRMFSVSPDELALGSTTVPRHATAQEADRAERLRRDEMVAYRIEGPIFFGAANRFFERLLKMDKGVRLVLLRLGGVPVMDATGASALDDLLDHLERRGIMVVLSGLRPQPRGLLSRMGILDRLNRRGKRVFATTDEALAAIESGSLTLKEAGAD